TRFAMPSLASDAMIRVPVAAVKSTNRAACERAAPLFRARWTPHAPFATDSPLGKDSDARQSALHDRVITALARDRVSHAAARTLPAGCSRKTARDPQIPGSDVDPGETDRLAARGQRGRSQSTRGT